jgi:hypothetical protein
MTSQRKETEGHIDADFDDFDGIDEDIDDRMGGRRHVDGYKP